MPPFIEQFGTMTVLRKIITARDISLVIAVPTAGGLVGLLITSTVRDKYGRKNILFLRAIINMISAVLQTAVYNQVMFIVG